MFESSKIFWGSRRVLLGKIKESLSFRQCFLIEIPFRLLTAIVLIIFLAFRPILYILFLIVDMLTCGCQRRPSSNTPDLPVWGKSFLRPIRKRDRELLCSICLCEDANTAIIVSRNEESQQIGESVCCSSYFHKDCLIRYWNSIGIVKCPNCRHSV